MLWELLKQQAAKYCGMDSTSLPAETAQELLASLTYTLSAAANADGLTAENLLRSDLSAVLERGQALLAARRNSVYAAWNHVWTAPDLHNVYYVDTLKNIGAFFDRYDLYYAAHQIPCSIDYPLLVPVSEQLQGISYIEAYLRQIQAENRFVCCFSPEAVRTLLRAADPDYQQNYLNLCEPVLIHALGGRCWGPSRARPASPNPTCCGWQSCSGASRRRSWPPCSAPPLRLCCKRSDSAAARQTVFCRRWHLWRYGWNWPSKRAI